MLQQSYVSGSRSQSALEMPLVIPQTVWFAGLAFFLAVALLLLARALHACLRGDLDDVFRLIGSKSAVAEAKEEIRRSSARSTAERQQMTAAVSPGRAARRAGSSIAVAAGMGLVGLILNQLYSPMPLTRMLGELAWSTTSNFILTAIPVLHHVRRDPAAQRNRRAHVQRAGPVAAPGCRAG